MFDEELKGRFDVERLNIILVSFYYMEEIWGIEKKCFFVIVKFVFKLILI